MASRFSLSFLIIALLFCCQPVYTEKEAPQVVNGEIDLTGWSFDKDGPVRLDGKWLFSWGEFIEPDTWVELKKKMVHQAVIPGRWQTLNHPINPNEMLPGIGHASYALRIKGLNHLAFDLSSTWVRGAGRKFILDDDGSSLLIADEGRIGKTAGDEVPINFIDLVVTYQVATPLEDKPSEISDVIILLHYSNYYNERGGIDGLVIAEAGQLVEEYNANLNRKGIMLGILLIIGLYHFILFVQRPDDKSILYFSLLCLLFAMRQFVTGVAQSEGYGANVEGFKLLKQLAFTSLVLVPLCGVYYIRHLLPSSTFGQFSRALLFPAALLQVYILFADIVNLSSSIDVIFLYIYLTLAALMLHLVVCFSQKKQGATLALIAFLIVCFGSLNDILLSKNLIQTLDISAFTSSIFILMNAVLIARRANKDFSRVQSRTTELAAEVRAQTAKLNRIQNLSQQIQNTSDLSTMGDRLRQTLRTEFNIEVFTFLIVNEETQQLSSYRLETNHAFLEVMQGDKDIPSISLSDPGSTHAAVVRHKKSIHLRKLPERGGSDTEVELTRQLEISASFIIPLIMDNRVYALFSFHDFAKLPEKPIKNLRKEQRADLELLSQYVSSALYQALQKEQIEKAKEEAEHAHAIASRIRNEASISQLAAHLAHEVNNPLNYISTGTTMQKESFEMFYQRITNELVEDNSETAQFKAELEKLYEKFKRGSLQTDEGQARITKVIAEIRAITGVDGLQFAEFDLVPIINEELVYSLQRNQIKIGEQSIKVTGTDQPLKVMSNSHILARSIRTIISNCIHFARQHKGDSSELYIDCKIENEVLLIDIGNNSYSIKNKDLSELFDLEISKSYGTEQIGLAMIKELLVKINSKLVLADHGRQSGKVKFQIQVPVKG